MIKKFLLIGGIALALSESVHAGVYVGGGMGFSALADQQNTSIPYESHQLGEIGFMGGGLLGYNFCLPCSLGLGLETFLNGYSEKAAVNHHFNGTSLTVSSNYNYGLRILPGFKFTQNTMGYIILGVVRGNFKIADNGVYGIVNNEFTKTGYQTGFGTAINIWCQELTLRGDIIYSKYGNQTSNGTTRDGFYNAYENRLSTLDGMVTLIYNFA